MEHNNHEDMHEMDSSKKMDHTMHMDGPHDHHAMMEEDFRKRFYVSSIVTIPVLLLSPTIQRWFNFTIPRFMGYDYVLFILATVIAIPVAAGILMPWGITLRPEWGALIMSTSSIIVVINALSLRNERLD